MRRWSPGTQAIEPTEGRANPRRRERPEAYVSALIGDGHAVTYSRDVRDLGLGATDEAVLRYAERERTAVLSTDVKDFGRIDAEVAVLVAPQDMTGGAVSRAVHRLESLDFDPISVDPIWLSTL